MRKLTFKSTAFFLFLFSIKSYASSNIYPNYMEHYAEKELSDVIYDLMPPNSSLKSGWNTLSDSYIRWFPSNTEEQGLMKQKIGLARINILGNHALKLYPNNQSLSWEIAYKSTSPQKEGIQYISMRPIGVNQEMCLGKEYKNCIFSIEDSLRHSNIAYKETCQSHTKNLSIRIFKIRSNNRNDTLAAQITTQGSLGKNTSLTLFINSKSAEGIVRLCERYKFSRG